MSDENVKKDGAQQSSEAKTAEAKSAEEKRVEIFVPRGYANDEQNVLIGINGVNYLLPKGKTSKVPEAVAAEFLRSQKAQAKLDEKVDALLEASK